MIHKKKKSIYISILLLSLSGVFLFFLNLEKNYHIKIPLKITVSIAPAIQIKINHKSIWADIDLGSHRNLILHKDVLQDLGEKEISRITTFKDFKGNKYTSSCYKISKITIGNLEFKKIIAEEENESFEQNIFFGTIPNYDTTEQIEEKATLGMELLKNYNLLFDFQKEIFCISNDKRKLKKLGYDLENFVKVPFEFKNSKILINVKSEIGFRKFLIDTGSTLTILRKYPCFTNISKEKYGIKMINVPNFILGSENFAMQELFLLNLSALPREVDGVLGVDFLKKHTSYIDFKNKILYLKK